MKFRLCEAEMKNYKNTHFLSSQWKETLCRTRLDSCVGNWGRFVWWVMIIMVFNECCLLLSSGPAGALPALPLALVRPGLEVALLRAAASPSCCGFSERLCPCNSCCCSSWAWHVWCPWLRRTTAVPTPTTSPAPSTPCSATPTAPRPYEPPITLHSGFLQDPARVHIH